LQEKHKIHHNNVEKVDVGLFCAMPNIPTILVGWVANESGYLHKAKQKKVNVGHWLRCYH
jgi:hypothetical protein